MFVPIHFKYKRSHSFVKNFLFYSRWHIHDSSSIYHINSTIAWIFFKVTITNKNTLQFKTVKKKYKENCFFFMSSFHITLSRIYDVFK